MIAFWTQILCVITHTVTFWLLCLHSERHVYEGQSAFISRAVCWLRAEFSLNTPSSLSPTLCFSLFNLRDIFQLWSLSRAARSIRIDCPWRAAPLSSQCQPVCDREGEKWRKISAALAVSFPHTWVGRLPVDRTVGRNGVEFFSELDERADVFVSLHFVLGFSRSLSSCQG